MGEVMWLEVLGRGGEVASRHRLDGGEWFLGRAYDNGVVVDDPSVAPHHLRIARDESGAWVVDDRGSVNGLFVDGARERCARVVLRGGEVLRVGRTLLRFRPASFPVPPEHPLTTSWLGWPVVGVLALVAGTAVLVRTWLGQTTQPEVSHYVLPLGAFAMFLIAWTGFWALMSRIFAGHAWVEKHLFIALCALVADLVIDALWSTIVYAFAFPVGVRWEAVVGWFFLAAIVYAHLRVIGPGHRRVKAASVLVMALAAIGVQKFGMAQVERMTGGQESPATLLPPTLRLVDGKDEAAFFAGTLELKTKLDRTRTEELPAALLPDLDPQN
jgi:pSer/pThr/pTyr-binding forkhead associated (FHA) protein